MRYGLWSIHTCLRNARARMMRWLLIMVTRVSGFVVRHRYYELMYDLAESGLFSGLAHPNSLQCFDAYPINNYESDYVRIARALHKHNMYIEESSGLTINYGDIKLGMNKSMMKVMLQNGVKIHTASDAHVPENTGKFIVEMSSRIMIESKRLNDDLYKNYL